MRRGGKVFIMASRAKARVRGETAPKTDMNNQPEKKEGVKSLAKSGKSKRKENT